MKSYARSLLGRPFLAITPVVTLALVLAAGSAIRAVVSGLGTQLLWTAPPMIWDTDAAWNPTNNIGIAVGRQGDFGPFVMFFDSSGTLVKFNGITQTVFPLVSGGTGLYNRVAARDDGNSGGFMVTYAANGARQAILIRGDGTLAGPLQVGAADASPNLEHVFDGAGLAYAKDFDKFLVTYVLHDAAGDYQTWLAAVDPVNMTIIGSPIQVSAPPSTDTCPGHEILDSPEIAYDPGSHTALVVGARDPTECKPGGGAIFARRIGFDGTNLSTLSSNTIYLTNGPDDEDPRVAFGAGSGKFVVVWDRRGSTTRSILKSTIDTAGNVAGPVTILPPNLNNNTVADDAFNELGLAYNATSDRFLIAMRGNDGSDPSNTSLAPAYALELNGTGDAIAGTLGEFLPPSLSEFSDFWPAPVAIQGTNRFVIVIKTGNEALLYASLVQADGTTGTGWPGGSGGGTPPPSGGGSGSLVITKPTGGTITGPGINCGDAGNVCSEALPNGMTLGLAETPSAGFTFSGWVGCASGLVTINGTTTCGATFSGSGTPPPHRLLVAAAVQACWSSRSQPAARSQVRASTAAMPGTSARSRSRTG